MKLRTKKFVDTTIMIRSHTALRLSFYPYTVLSRIFSYLLLQTTLASMAAPLMRFRVNIKLDTLPIALTVVLSISIP